MKTSFFIAVFLIAACTSGSLTSDPNNGSANNGGQFTTSDDDLGQRPKKDVAITPNPTDMGSTNDVSKDTAIDITEDMSTQDTTAPVDMNPPQEGELMLFADVLANCDPQTMPTPNCAPAPPISTGNYNVDCVNRINQFRALCQCLPPLQRWTDGEQCAAEQSEYDSERSQAHAGFRAGICNGGGGQNECPGYRSEQQVIGTCLQQMWSEGPGEPFSAHGHYINMTNARFSSVACGIFQGNNGTWAIQNFR